MNNLDKQYTALLQDILDNGQQKSDRTGTGTLSVFGRQIRHKMSEGFPLLTTKKMYMKGIVTELLWFLRGDTNIKFLVDNDCHIWDGDAYKNYVTNVKRSIDRATADGILQDDSSEEYSYLSKESFIQRIKTDDEFAKTYGELGPVYGRQWRSWTNYPSDVYVPDTIDQIANLIRDLKTNPDSRRLMVNAWNVGELDSMVLPPCHYGFQVYTRELSNEERCKLAVNEGWMDKSVLYDIDGVNHIQTTWTLNANNIPTRAISLMWNQRSVDTFLGLPFNIASYGLLLEIIAKAVNMVPDELIGNLGDVHLYSNHIEQAKEQIGKSYTHEERNQMLKESMGEEEYWKQFKDMAPFGGGLSEYYDSYKIPKRTKEPFPLPTLNINTEFWPYEGGECGIGPIDAVKVFEAFKNDNFCRCLLEEDIQLGNYQSHPTIKAPLSN